jgi:hypothetical protein
MQSKTIKFEDYNGVERTVVTWHNLSQAQIIKLQMEYNGKLEEVLNDAIATKNMPVVLELFEKIIVRSFGIPAGDGLHFDNSPEVQKKFRTSAAYEALEFELLTNPEAAENFIVNLLPAKMMKKAKEEIEHKKAELLNEAKEAKETTEETETVIA